MFGKNKPTKEDTMETLNRVKATGSFSRAITDQEADGQRSFVNSDTLPTQMRREDRVALESAGVIFGEVVPGDDLFQYVTLPAGWKKSGTSHDMHNDLLDAKGRKRAGIFYKAAFYDRRADLNCVRRFSIGTDWSIEETGFIQAVAKDGKTELFRSKSIKLKNKDDYKENDTARKIAVSEVEAWMVKNGYPDWQNASAYWD